MNEVLTLNFPPDGLASVPLALSMNMGGPERDGSPQVSAQRRVVPRCIFFTIFQSTELLDLQNLSQNISLEMF